MRQVIRSLFPQKRLSASIVASRTVGVGANATGPGRIVPSRLEGSSDALEGSNAIPI